MADSPPVVNPVSNPVARQLRATSLNRALLVLGDWWTVLLLREAFLGVRQFDQFQARLAIPRQTLTNRLRELVAAGLFEPRPYQQRPLRHEYRLTPKGLALYPWALLLWKWQRRWGQQSINPLPEQLLHRRCGQAMTPVFACGHCRQPAVLRDMAWQERTAASTAEATPEAPPPVRATRHTVSRELLDGEHLYRHGAFIVADRWTHLILGCAYLGVTRFGHQCGSLVLGRSNGYGASDLRGEPSAGKPHARICEGEAAWPSYSTINPRTAQVLMQHR